MKRVCIMPGANTDKQNASSIRPLKIKFNRIKHLLFFIILLSTLNANSTVPKYYKGYGRIAISTDGNQHDMDDYGASPGYLAFIAAAKLQDKLVHFQYNNHIWDSRITEKVDSRKIMHDGVIGAGELFQFDTHRFFDCVAKTEATVKDLTKHINESSENNPLFILLGGPMEMVYRSLAAADVDKRQYVCFISHSGWNDKHGAGCPDGKSCHEGSHQKGHILGLEGINKNQWQAIEGQNEGYELHKGLNSEKVEGASEEEKWAVWDFMKNSCHPGVQFTYSRMELSKKPDWSDAGMAYYVVTGDEFVTPAKVEDYFKQHFECIQSNKQKISTSKENVTQKYVKPEIKYGENFIVFEAEATNSELGLWALRKPGNSAYYKGKDLEAINHTYLEFTGNTMNGGKPTSPLVYKFICPKTGNYKLAMRMYQHLMPKEKSDKRNDVWVKMDGNYESACDFPIENLKEDHKFFGRGIRQWGALVGAEGHVNGIKENSALIYKFKKGEEYTLTISGRSQSCCIDYILLFEDKLELNAKANIDLATGLPPKYLPALLPGMEIQPVKVAGVKIKQSDLKLEMGQSKILHEIVIPIAATNKQVQWSSANNNIVSVSKRGTITAQGLGETTITVSTLDGNKKASIKVSVEGTNSNSKCIEIRAVDFNKYTGIEGFANAKTDSKGGKDILQIGARLKTAAAQYTYNGKPQMAVFKLNTLLEKDGESTFKVKVNGILVGQVVNDRIHGTQIKDYTIKNYTINPKPFKIKEGDIIQVEFNNATNGLVPEKETTATSRGRWYSLEICSK